MPGAYKGHRRQCVASFGRVPEYRNRLSARLQGLRYAKYVSCDALTQNNQGVSLPCWKNHAPLRATVARLVRLKSLRFGCVLHSAFGSTVKVTNVPVPTKGS